MSLAVSSTEIEYPGSVFELILFATADDYVTLSKLP